ncbi:MAG TPA: radical SAM family heme chaperone HemW [Longimicrobiales bacterium]|nr:radical SAM family heme chaperone HemW [Longimicrobiales bacterium]
MTPAYLYIHVPFCLRRCSYCDFAVTATREPPIDAWLDAIDAELTLLAREEGWAAPLELRTLYIGGGTPSLLGLGAMERLRARLERHARWDDAAVEWTAEANPETLTPALAADWRAAGVNRISLGAQTFHEPTLRWMGRLHGADGPARAVAACRESGIDNVSLDLIFGLPARLGRDWDADLGRAIALEPAHVSLYGLTAESGTPLGRWVAEGRERMVDEDAYAAEYLLAAERMGAAGFEHYEVSNFARSGRQSVHNGAYWTGAAYVGLGPGAHSFLPPERRWNERDWMAYRHALEEGRLPRVGAERVDADAARLESLWLGLRASAGVPLDRLGRDQLRLVDRWVAEGWAHTGDDRLRLTRHGWLLLDRLAVELDERAA